MSDHQESDDPTSELISKLPAKLVTDTVRPIAKELARSGEIIGSTINALLRPLSSFAQAYQLVWDRLDGWLLPKLRGVPKSKLVSPPPNVAGNLISGLVFAQHEPELRKMFLNLLASSMVVGLRERAHPSFVTILRDMTPDEARIILHTAARQHIPAIRLRQRRHAQFRDSERDVASCISWRTSLVLNLDALVGEDNFDDRPWANERLFIAIPRAVRLSNPQSVPTYLDNFLRQRLFQPHYDNGFVDHAAYHEIRDSTLFKETAKAYRANGCTVSTLQCVVTVTDFGKQFIATCAIGPDNSAAVRETPAEASSGKAGNERRRKRKPKGKQALPPDDPAPSPPTAAFPAFEGRRGRPPDTGG
jgi:hypothetical protein